MIILMEMFNLSLSSPTPPLKAPKVFKAENPEVPKLDNYTSLPPDS